MQNRIQKQANSNKPTILFVDENLLHIEYRENISICNNGYKAMNKRIKETEM